MKHRDNTQADRLDPMTWQRNRNGLILPPTHPLGPDRSRRFLPGYPCCCAAGCGIFEDYFNRANSSDIGSDWTETTGDWSISGNKLSVATSGAECTCNATRPNDSVVVSVDITLGTTGEAFITAAGHTVRIRQTHAELYEGVTLKKTETISSLGPFARSLSFCVTTSGASLTVDATGSSGVLIFSATGGATSGACSVGTITSASGAPIFDNFIMSNHPLVRSGQDCLSCSEVCQTACFFEKTPSIIQVEIAGFTTGTWVSGIKGGLCNCVDWNGTWAVEATQSGDCAYKGGACTCRLMTDEQDSCRQLAGIRLFLFIDGVCIDFSEACSADGASGCGVPDCSWATFQLTGQTDMLCLEMDELDIPLVSANSPDFCTDNGSATCKITTLL